LRKKVVALVWAGSYPPGPWTTVPLEHIGTHNVKIVSLKDQHRVNKFLFKHQDLKNGENTSKGSWVRKITKKVNK